MEGTWYPYRKKKKNHNKNLFEIGHRSKCKRENINLLEENEYLHIRGLSNTFLNKAQKPLTTGEKLKLCLLIFKRLYKESEIPSNGLGENICNTYSSKKSRVQDI